jgi:hypothetical protein
MGRETGRQQGKGALRLFIYVTAVKGDDHFKPLQKQKLIEHHH